MDNVWVYIPLFARVLGIIGYSKLDNYVAKKWHLSSGFLWVTYYAAMGLWPSVVTDFLKVVVLFISLPRTKKYRDELLEKRQNNII